MERIISKGLPDIPIVPEENKTGLPEEEFHRQRAAILNQGTFLLMDDLDATFAFKSGFPYWGHMAGLAQKHQLTHCAMNLPAREVLVTAAKGKGCFINGQQIRLNQQLAMAECGIYLPFHKDIAPDFMRDVCLKILAEERPGGCFCLNSNIGGVVSLLEGKLGGFIGCGHNWDFVGALAVQEAGGTAHAAWGGSLLWDEIPIIMVAGANREIALALLKHTQNYPHYERDFWNNPKFQA